VPFEGGPIPAQQMIELGNYALSVTFEKPQQPTNMPGLDPGQWLSGGVIINEGPDEYLIAGTGLIVTFALREPDDDREQAGIASIQDGRFVGGKWKILRWLSGDESHQGRHLRIPSGQFGIQRIKLYRYR
jgi:hypothetical protein